MAAVVFLGSLAEPLTATATGTSPGTEASMAPVTAETLVAAEAVPVSHLTLVTLETPSLCLWPVAGGEGSAHTGMGVAHSTAETLVAAEAVPVSHLTPVVTKALVSHLTLIAHLALVDSLVGKFTAAIQVAIDVFTAAVDEAIDLFSAAVEAVSHSIPAGVTGPVSLTVEAVINGIAPPVETVVDAVPAVVEAVLDPLAPTCFVRQDRPDKQDRRQHGGQLVYLNHDGPSFLVAINKA